MFGSIAVATSLFLSQAKLTYDIVKDYTYRQEQSLRQEYENASNNVCYSLRLALYQICEIRNITPQEAKELREFLDFLNQAKIVAQNRVKTYQYKCDKNVLYSILSVTHILESVLDDEFMNLTGGYRMPDDILAFGKGLYDLS